LKRAWISESELKKERDHLEQTVEERTRELKQAQLEKMFQMYRFVEFGRLASGFFHDMTVPLTTVSLNLDAIKSVHSSTEVDQAIVGAKKMGAYVRAIRKQLQKQTVMTKFSLDREVSEVLSIMAAKAREERVLFIFEKEKITMYGNPLKFSQLLTNLISNAIDSYDQVRGKNTRTIHIVLKKKKGVAHISVKDHGKGIPLQLQPKIFEPFVTTKLEKGMGLGLSFCKTIVTKEYHGTISFVSTEGEGTTFTIEIPMVKRKN
jgi:signal transduction histidine kinase